MTEKWTPEKEQLRKQLNNEYMRNKRTPTRKNKFSPRKRKEETQP
jgi:hypothetical protein